MRNIRAYQDRGLLSPPERRGRKGIYGDTHRSRLRIINHLLRRGYSLANIRELIGHWERGNTIADLLGLQNMTTSPWRDEVPAYMTMAELVHKFGHGFSPAAVRKAIELDVIRPEGACFCIPSPRMLNAGAELTRMGIPLEAMLDVVASLRQNLGQTCDAMLQLVAHYVFDPNDQSHLPTAAETPQLASVVWRLEPLLEMAVLPEIARAMEQSADTYLGERLTRVLNHEQTPEPDG